MKKILLIIMVIIFCTACSKIKTLPESEDLPKLSDYPVIEEDVNNIINELKESGEFDDIKFDDFEKSEFYDDPDVRYYVRYNTNCSDFDLSYDEAGNFDGIHLAKDTGFCDVEEQYFSDLTWHNQLLAITYLKRYDINESDFPGGTFDDTYEDYVSFMAGISEKKFIYTNNNKSLMLSYYPERYIFTISG